ncbi:hypothetical protein [Leucobacter chromiireducens]|uniref:hypothetical protein n=1 Tax=Leucobacter chromiireducens TaxID=283877 RepID=UPI000F644427|nr:hypothetical protein [Leucobacter chromiireducens]
MRSHTNWGAWVPRTREVVGAGASRRWSLPRRPRTWGRLAHLALLGAFLAGGLVATGEAPARALPRGETMTFPGGLVISNYVMPNGTRAYCIEIQYGEPTGNLLPGTRTNRLPGRSGQLTAWGDPHGMRQLNYLIDTRGQTRDPWQAAAVQITVWRMRENFRAGNPYLNAKIAILTKSAEGRRLISASDALYREATERARVPVPAAPVTGTLSLAQLSAGAERTVRVTYPAGTTELSVTGGKFQRSGTTRLAVSGGAGAETIAVAEGAEQVEVAGRWASTGKRGWESQLTVHDTRTASGGNAQRIAVAVGASAVPKLNGRFDTVSIAPPLPPAPPRVASLAQVTAEVGGTMRDELLVTEQPGTRAEVWDGAMADFTAYLLPEAGAPKYDENWEIIRVPDEAPEPGEEPERPEAEDPDPEEAAPEEAAPEDPASEHPAPRIPAPEATVPRVTLPRIPAPEAIVPRLTRPGGIGSLSGATRDAAQGKPERQARAGQERGGSDAEAGTPRAPERWTAEEIAALSPDELCVAQPVAHDGGIAITGPGTFRSQDIPVRSAGTVHWVERVTVAGTPVHTGSCGLANETTKVSAPGVVTKAPASVRLGETLEDTATVSGTLARGARYSIRFDAYREAYGDDGAPECRAEQRVFRSPRLPVTKIGDITSPGFPARWAHGERIWWVESLYLDSPATTEAIHTGACGIASETTAIERPSVQTRAPEHAAIGDRIVDTAEVSEGARAGEGTRWEVSFAGYRGAEPRAGGDEAPSDAAEPDAEAPACVPENLLFEAGATPVDGPGTYTSPPVEVLPEWAGTVWWVATLWLIEGEQRIPVDRGSCGDLTESTRVVAPELTTQATSIAALGEPVTDVATITGELSQRPGLLHEVVFEGYLGDAALTGTGDAVCAAENRVFTTPPTRISEPGEVRAPQFTAAPKFGETLWWVAVLTQREEGAPPERARELARGACGDPEETTSVLWPTVRTEAMGSVDVGDDVFDTAIVEGRLAEREGIEFRVRFTAYAAGADGELRCEPEREIAEYSDPAGVPVTGPGRYESRRVPARAELTGPGGFVETLIMTEDGRETVVHTGTCGATGERFEVRPPPDGASPAAPPPSLSTTGGSVTAALVTAGVLLAGALAAAASRRLRTRRGRGVGGDSARE